MDGDITESQSVTVCLLSLSLSHTLLYPHVLSLPFHEAVTVLYVSVNCSHMALLRRVAVGVSHTAAVGDGPRGH